MLKFQNNNTTVIATFEDFILTVYIILSRYGITAHIPHSNRTCAINAYGLPLCSTLRKLHSLALYCPYNNSMYPHKGCSFPPP